MDPKLSDYIVTFFTLGQNCTMLPAVNCGVDGSLMKKQIIQATL
jgi:hypothetical protein